MDSDSIQCSCNYIPGIYKYFEEDNIFPIEGVQKSFERIQELYRIAGATANCRLVIGEGGHRFYAKDSWPVFRELSR